MPADVIVIGGGNAGFCAAQSAVRAGARVTLLEKAPEDAAGGNSFYTAGAFRVVHGGIDEVIHVVEPDPRLEHTDLAPYTAEDYRSDMERLTQKRNDPAMTEILIGDSGPVVEWLRDLGLRWRLMYERQAYERDGRQVFWGGLALGTVDGGKGLIAQHTAAAREAGIAIEYDTPVTGLVDHGVATPQGTREADAVILAAGGFEASAELRERHLGPGWGRALVRGNPLNTGEVLQAALDAGAEPHGDWSTCHSVAWDAEAGAGGGDRELTNQYTRSGYPLGIMVNRDGRRFVDEGEDYRNYTYAKFGREILAQPGGVAFQLFDARIRPMLRKEEYDSSRVTGATADTFEELARELGIDPAVADTVEQFNAAIRRDVPFDAAVKDGRATQNIEPPKSNWAQPLETPPFYGFAVTCGVTFTFGGVRVDEHARVVGVPGLYAAGELVGGLFSGNYPGGTGLTAGAVFGRRAGAHAASQ